MLIAIIRPDGTLAYDDAPDDDHGQLRAFQDIVGGDIQLAPIEFHGCDAFVNEEGIDLGLARNRTAEHALDWPAALLGPVIVTGGLYGETDVDLTNEQRQALDQAMRSVRQ